MEDKKRKTFFENTRRKVQETINKMQKDNPNHTFHKMIHDGDFSVTLVFRERCYHPNGTEILFTSDEAYKNYIMKEVKK